MAVVERFQTIVPIDNPSKGEEKIRAFIAQTLQTIGVSDQHVDLAGNLFVRVPGAAPGPVVMLSAHMDSVPPCHGIEPVVDTDPRTGRPIIRSGGKTILGADDKSGIAVILELVSELAASDFKNNYPLELLFSTEEEIGLNGAKGFDMSLTQASHCYVLDGEGRVGLIFNAGPSQENLQVRCLGRASHAGIAPESGVSAIMMAAEFCAQAPSGRLAEDLTTNLGVIEGGKANNIVADEVLIRGEARSHDEAKLAGLLETFRHNADMISQRFSGGRIEVETIRRYDRFWVAPEHPSIQAAMAICEEMGILPQTAPMNIGSDAHILNKNGLPTVVLGMGFHYSHSLGEFIYCEELAQVYELVKRLVCDRA